MRAGQAVADVNMEQSCAHARRTPRCYSRQAPRDGIDQADPVGESSTTLAVCGVMTCAAAAFLVVYGSWGL